MQSTDNNSEMISVVKVKPRTLWSLKHNLLLWAILIAIVLLIFFLSSISLHSEKKPKYSPEKETSDYESVLQVNLDALQRGHHREKAAPTDIVPVIQPLADNAVRRNAPTTMLATSASSSSVSVNSGRSTGAAATPLFAGNNAMVKFANQDIRAAVAVAQKFEHSETTVASGEVIQAILETPIHSDLPGMVRAIVSQPVYSYVGEKELIPAGSRLIGQYAAEVLQGQQRIFAIWNRVILPNGIHVQINSPGADRLGMAGQAADTVDSHFMQRFGQATLLSILGAGTSTVGVNPMDEYNSASMYRAALSQSFQQSANESLKQTVAIKPTLRVYQGAEITVFVARDCDFYQAMSKKP